MTGPLFRNVPGYHGMVGEWGMGGAKVGVTGLGLGLHIQPSTVMQARSYATKVTESDCGAVLAS